MVFDSMLVVTASLTPKSCNLATKTNRKTLQVNGAFEVMVVVGRRVVSSSATITTIFPFFYFVCSIKKKPGLLNVLRQENTHTHTLHLRNDY